MDSTNTNRNKNIKKFWTSKDKGNDSIILVANDMIYKGNKKPENLNESISQIYSDKIPKGLFSLPYKYINKIQMQEGKNYLGIIFNQDSNEQLRILDENKRREVFDYFKENIQIARYEFVEYSIFKTIKKPLVAFVVITLLSFWAYGIANMLENGEGVGTQLVIVLFLAGLGTKNLLIFYSIFLAILTISISLKLRNKPKIHELSFK